VVGIQRWLSEGQDSAMNFINQLASENGA
jgi:hypothetical protein